MNNPDDNRYKATLNKYIAAFTARIDAKRKKYPKTVDGYTDRITVNENEIDRLHKESEALRKITGRLFYVPKKIYDLKEENRQFRQQIAHLLANAINYADGTTTTPILTPSNEKIKIQWPTSFARPINGFYKHTIQHFLIAANTYPIPRIRLFDQGLLIILTYDACVPRYHRRMHPLRYQNAAKRNNDKLIWVVGGGNSDKEVTHYGIIKPSGEFEPSINCNQTVIELLNKFESTPAIAVAEFGQLTGICTLCGRMLNKPEHVLNCAIKFGIQW